MTDEKITTRLRIDRPLHIQLEWETAALTALHAAGPSQVYPPRLPGATPADVDGVMMDLYSAGYLTHTHMRAGGRGIGQPPLQMSYKGEHEALRRKGIDPQEDDARVMQQILRQAHTNRTHHFPVIAGVGDDRLTKLTRFMVREGVLEFDAASANGRTETPQVRITVSGIRLQEFRNGVQPAEVRSDEEPASRQCHVACSWKARAPAESAPANV